MKKLLWLNNVNLQLFAEGAGGTGGGTAAEGAAGVSAADPGQQDTGVQNGATDGGVAAADPGQQQQVTDPTAAFEDLIRGQYKDQYNAKVKDTIDKRLKSVHQQLTAYEAATPIFDILAQKYGVEATDYAAIAEAIKADASLVEKEALERGMDVQDYMKMRNVEMENASMRRQMEQQRKTEQEQQRQQQVNEQVNKWTQQAEQAKQVYPGLDLETEIKNPDFSRLLGSGVDVRTAYEVIHKDEIMQGAMQYAAQRAAKNVTDNVIAGAARPVENGTAAQGAVSAKVDPSKLTDKQIREYRERAAKGERITF